jgi:acyl carrier protein
MNDTLSVESRIARFFATRLHVEIPGIDDDLVETGVLDSLALVELVLFLNQELQADVPLDDIDGFRSIRRIAGLVASVRGPD